MASKTKKQAKTKNQKTAEVELAYISKMYKIWSKLQDLMSELEDAGLNHAKTLPDELLEFNGVCAYVEDAFVRFEAAARKRSMK